MNVRLSPYLVVALAAPLLLAACGGGGSSASSAGSSTTTAAGNASQTALRDCLQKHGVTLPAGFGNRGSGPPASGGTPSSFPAGGTPGSLPAGVDAQKMQSAFQACGGTGNGFGGGGRNGQAFQAYTACLRDHGVKVPVQTGSTTPPTFDRNSSVFVAANKVCAALLPNTSTTTTTPSN
jgi:hypothetical protein